MAFLEMREISKYFVGVAANEKVSLHIDKGEILALLGENGAGKTTLMNILYGLYQADKGEIYLENKKVSFACPRDAIKAGIGMVHQHFMLIPSLTVMQNIILGLKPKGSPFISYRKIEKEILNLSKKYGLTIDGYKKISELSVGEQQRVEILKSLYRQAKLLIFDEPTAVLTPQETKEFFNILRKLKEDGYGIVIITHRMSEIMTISDRVTILRDGRNVITVETKDTTPQELSFYMIGRSINNTIKRNSLNKNKDILLSLKNVEIEGKAENRLRNINLDIYNGEIIGVAGVDGNGQKELSEIIAGIRNAHKGEIKFKGQSIKREKVSKRYNKGIAYVPDDRHKDGLVMDMNVSENLILRSYNKTPFSKKWIKDYKAIKEMSEKMIASYNIKTPKNTTLVRNLSGGNQQKIILARELYEDPELIVVSQPTRGLDIGATQYVRQLLINRRNNKKSVLLISADLEEILELSDRIAVMFGGEIVGVLKNDHTLNKQTIGALMGGHIHQEQPIYLKEAAQS